jgi:HlyD family secretion protein
MVEITEGLAEGDLVVAKAGAFVRSGDRVNPVPASLPAN